MTDDVLRDLVLKHENTIHNLTKSVESLVESNAETNKRLEEISKYLAKQVVFDTKLSALDKELGDSFKRVHNRIDGLEKVQSSDSGCKSVQLLGKDVDGLEKGYVQMAGTIGDIKINTEKMERQIDALPSTTTIRWSVALIAMYMISFGSYVVSSLQDNEVQVTKIIEHISK